jgi:LacI family transcriptional regulator
MTDTETRGIEPVRGSDRPAAGNGRRVNAFDVARLAGISKSSVSRVLAGHPDVSSEMHERVSRAVRQLGYTPDLLAASLRRGATLSVGFVLTSIASHLHAEIVSGAESRLREFGYSLLLMDSDNDPNLDSEYVRILESRRVDGLLLAPASDRNQRIQELVRHSELPIVAIDRELPSSRVSSAVLTDSRPGTIAAVHHLVALGHRRIALISGTTDIYPARDRIAAFQSAVAAESTPVRTFQVDGTFSVEHGEAATQHLLDLAEPPTAIITGGFQLLIGCLTVLRKRGTRVGRDISLITWDHSSLAELYDPPISTISRDTTRLGQLAAQTLLDRISGTGQPPIQLIPSTFTVTPSCNDPSGRPYAARREPRGQSRVQRRESVRPESSDVAAST